MPGAGSISEAGIRRLPEPWGVHLPRFIISAATLLVCFLLFQPQFARSFMHTGIKQLSTGFRPQGNGLEVDLHKLMNQDHGAARELMIKAVQAASTA